MVLLAWLFYFIFLLTPASAQTWATIPFSTQSLPIALRSPYLNSWLSQGKLPSETPSAGNAGWPVFWTSSPPVVAWYIAVRVDGLAYTIFGDAAQPHQANQTAAIITPTQTTFIVQAGPVSVNATFLSPIEPTDLVRQSMPFTYLYVDVASTDGQPHAVQLYSDISAEWLSGDRSMICNWTANTNSDYISLQTQLQSPIPFAEIADQALDATAYLSMSKQASSTWQIGRDVDVRGQFNTSGVLLQTQDSNFRAIADNFPVFGISVDLGTITKTFSSNVWLLGLLRDPVVQYSNGEGNNELRSPYFWSQYPTAQAAISFLLNDFTRARDAGNAMDAKILGDAQKISSPYADMVTLSARQALSAVDITLKKENNGSWNTSDVKAFFKNMGGVGGPGVNAVDMLFSTFPAYLYLNPAIAGYLLSPLLEFQSSKLYALPYAAHDIGLAYPNATGNSNPHNEGIEQSANMLIMTLAHAQFSGDGTLISKYYPLLRTWADYLVNNTLSPDAQTTSDSLTSANQTNLAIKGIIGIAAMSKISEFIGDHSFTTHYQTVSSSYESEWQSLSLAADGSHLLANYGLQSSSGLMYNLFADKLLQLNVVPNTVYQAQTNFTLQSSKGSPYGLPIDSSTPTKSRTDWMIFAASSASDSATRDELVLQVHNFVTAGVTNEAFPLIYDPTSANFTGGPGSPAQGAMFSMLVLNHTLKTPSVPPNSFSPASAKVNAGAIAGGVIGGLVAVAIVVFLAWFLHRRRQHIQSEKHDPSFTVDFDGVRKPGGYHTYSSGTIEPFAESTIHPFTVASTNTSSHPNLHHTVVPRGLADVDVRGSHGSEYYHRRAGSDSDVGPSASQVGGPTASEGSERPLPVAPASNVLMAKQTLVNEELRTEVDNLRREMERIRIEREQAMEAPPSYGESH
ncbi:DUF1793-domain-containing protein [Rickenella mellea]|uniref:DUF1793-domain-containing protein n=1 Tax=Rickenella mellea TaxID=50990 RepID=A0A4Y7QK54_9AGAM|nr:DUF1793-domain-containing protein [Rickenella mellea]